MKNRAINALIEMGMNADCIGFHYIADIMEMFEDEKIRFGKITALYSIIANRKDTTDSSVERAIRHAFGMVIKSADVDSVNKWLTFKNPTNGNLLNVFYIRLKQEEENEKNKADRA